MFLVLKCIDFDDKPFYDDNSFIGVFDDFKTAHEKLVMKLNELLYEYDEEEMKTGYAFFQITSKNGKEVNNGLCFKIIPKKFAFNEVMLKK